MTNPRSDVPLRVMPASPYDLTNKRAVMTGASQGIGAAAAVTFARAGADVAFTYQTATQRRPRIHGQRCRGLRRHRRVGQQRRSHPRLYVPANSERL